MMVEENSRQLNNIECLQVFGNELNNDNFNIPIVFH